MKITVIGGNGYLGENLLKDLIVYSTISKYLIIIVFPVLDTG